MQPFRFIDLFAGLGGFHLALDRLGGECVFAAEWKEHLRDLYRVNFGVRPEGDITLVSPKNVPDHDVLTAGFPCQPFSKAGEQLGFECTEQGNLFFNVAAILKKKRPTFFILENVPNLLKHDEGRTWQEIQKILGTGKTGLGYHIRAERFSPHNFGIPQIRERVYIVGSLLSLDEFKWPATSDAATRATTTVQPSKHSPATSPRSFASRSGASRRPNPPRGRSESQHPAGTVPPRVSSPTGS